MHERCAETCCVYCGTEDYDLHMCCRRCGVYIHTGDCLRKESLVSTGKKHKKHYWP